jgi:hypothetical protein
MPQLVGVDVNSRGSFLTWGGFFQGSLFRFVLCDSLQGLVSFILSWETCKLCLASELDQVRLATYCIIERLVIGLYA